MVELYSEDFLTVINHGGFKIGIFIDYSLKWIIDCVFLMCIDGSKWYKM